MSLTTLPTELILLISNKLTESDISALSQTNRRLYEIVSDVLYRQNIEYFNGYGIRWAVWDSNKPALLKFIQHGADVHCGGPPVEVAVRRTYIDAGIIPPDGNEYNDNNKDDNKEWIYEDEVDEEGLPDDPSFLYDLGPLGDYTAPDSETDTEYSDCSYLSGYTENWAEQRRERERTVKRYFHPSDPLLCYTAKKGDIALTEILLSHGAYPDARSWDWETPLMIASKEGHEDIVKLLLQSGAFVNALNASRQTALLLALKYDNVIIIEVLMDHGGIAPECYGEDNPVLWRESDLVKDVVMQKGEVALSQVVWEEE